MINFQKSRISAQDEKSFTINLAMASKRILAYHGEATTMPPPAYACHWANTRIGELTPERRDKWWTLSDEASYPPIAAEVSNAVSQLAVPLIKTHLTEEGLLELWLSKTPGSFELMRLKHKSVLLALQKKFDVLPEVFQRMRELTGDNFASTGTQQHITQLKKRFSLPD